MPNLLQRGATWLGDRLSTSAGRSVVLHSQGRTLSLTGWVSMHEYEVPDEAGGLVIVESWDWSFRTADLVLDGIHIKFDKGWQVRETLDGREISYDAMPVGNKPVAEMLDTSGILTLLHTKKIDVWQPS
jgi:hypothetical protein